MLEGDLRQRLDHLSPSISLSYSSLDDITHDIISLSLTLSLCALLFESVVRDIYI